MEPARHRLAKPYTLRSCTLLRAGVAALHARPRRPIVGQCRRCTYYIAGLIVVRREAGWVIPESLARCAQLALSSLFAFLSYDRTYDSYLPARSIQQASSPRTRTARSSGQRVQLRACDSASMPEAAAAGGGKAAARARAAAQEAALSVSLQKFTRGGQARSQRLVLRGLD